MSSGPRSRSPTTPPGARGIEDLEQLALLELEQCHSGQGFLFARPMPAHVLDGWLLDDRMLTATIS